MESKNHVSLAGRLVADPELRKTSTGKSVCSMRLATNDTKTAQFHTVVAWESMADTAAKLSKGAEIAVEGRLQTRSYEIEGQKRYATEVIATALAA